MCGTINIINGTEICWRRTIDWYCILNFWALPCLSCLRVYDVLPNAVTKPTQSIIIFRDLEMKLNSI